jgi:hypothetical protein
MKLIQKSDLTQIDGLLVGPDNDIVFLPKLVDEVNEITDLAELIDFAIENAAKIEASGSERVKFTPVRAEAPRIKTGEDAATPLNDEFTAAAQARAEEFLNAQQFSDVDAHLGRYSAIAKWLTTDYVTVRGDEYDCCPFKSDVFALTEEFVITTVKNYHDPKVRKLIGGVVIGR